MPGPIRTDVVFRILQAGIGWTVLVLLLMLVLVQGGNQPVGWTLFAAALLPLFALQVLLHLVRPPVRALRGAIPIALIYAGVLCWCIVQVALPAPAGLAHPVWSLAPAGAIPRIGADPAQGMHAVLRLASYAMVAWVLLCASLRERRALAYLKLVGLFSGLLAAYGIVAGLTGNNPLLEIDSGRAGVVTATFVNRNSYATYAAFGMLVNAGLFLHLSRTEAGLEGRQALRTFIERFFGGSWLFALAALLCAAAVALTESRGGGAAAVLGLIVLLASAGRRGFSVAIAVGVVVLLLAGFAATTLGSGTLDRMLAGEGGQTRAIVYAAIVEHIPERPWLGQGVGAFHDTFRAYLPLEAATAEWDLAHSSYLENAWEMGLPAAAAFYGALLLIGLRIGRGMFIRHSGTLVPAIALSVFVTGAAHATVDFSLQMPACAALFAAILGIGWAQSFSRSDRAGQDPRDRSAP